MAGLKRKQIKPLMYLPYHPNIIDSGSGLLVDVGESSEINGDISITDSALWEKYEENLSSKITSD